MAIPNLNVFSCEAGTYSISDAIAGQTPLIMYDALKQAALLPEVRASGPDGRASIIMPYAEKTPEALLSQMQAAWGAENRTVRSNQFYWLEYDSYDTLSFVIDKSLVAVPAAGNPVTCNFNSLSKSMVGGYVKPLASYYAWIKENNRQQVIISAVNGSSTVTLQPINGETLNLTQYSRYTIIIDPLRRYTAGDTNQITREGMVLNPPTMYKSFVQKYEKGFSINQDEIDNYVYDRDFKVIKGLNTRGEAVEFFYLPAINSQIEAFLTDNKNLNTLFGVRDNPNSKNFDGIIPTAEKFGMFNSGYDIYTNVSMKAILFGMIKTLRRINGCTDYMLSHDFNFSMDWSENLGELIKAANQSYKYELFGTGGVGARDFSYYSFQNFEAFGYKFTPYMLDIFDHRRYANILEYFALMMPLTKFKDQYGNTVPFITYVALQGAEPAKVNNIWLDDARKRGLRTYDIYCQTTWGFECHRPTSMGILKRTSSN
jgi:hypothetical protein